MSFVNGLPVNFTISEQAKAEFETIRQLYLEHTDDPPAVLMVGWGTTYFNAGGTADGVVVGYYGESQRAEAERGVEMVSGVELLFFITPENHWRFAGKLLDHSSARGFFLTERT